MFVKWGFQSNRVTYVEIVRFGTTCRVQNRGDFDIEGVRFSEVSL